MLTISKKIYGIATIMKLTEANVLGEKNFIDNNINVNSMTSFM